MPRVADNRKSSRILCLMGQTRAVCMGVRGRGLGSMSVWKPGLTYLISVVVGNCDKVVKKEQDIPITAAHSNY